LVSTSPSGLRAVHVTASRRSLSGLAGFPAQSHRPHRRRRSVRRSDGRVQIALRAGHPASGAATTRLDQCDSKSNRRVDRPADYRSIPMGWAPHYLIRDRDTSYGTAVTRRLRAMGIRDRPITARSPWQNGHIERLIGSIRRECLDHIVVLGERHLRHLFGELRHLNVPRSPPAQSRSPAPRRAISRRDFCLNVILGDLSLSPPRRDGGFFAGGLVTTHGRLFAGPGWDRLGFPRRSGASLGRSGCGSRKHERITSRSLVFCWKSVSLQH
jgi:hypothetical protein